MGLRRLGRKLLQGADYLRSGSCRIRDDRAVAEFLSNDENTVLVSFPRTGSHMVRMVMELYFERAILPRTFYHPLADDYLLHHTHDKELNFVHPTVIYLFREPVATVFSELRYRGRSPDDVEAADCVARQYGRHLARWTIREDFTRRKTTITYGQMTERPIGTVSRLCEHFRAEFDVDRARAVWGRVSKEEVARKTRHDPKVVKKDRDEYAREREYFRREYGDRVWRTVTEVDRRLGETFRAVGLGP